MIASSSHNIQIKYIPGHKGYKGNGIADSLAIGKEVADNSHTLESIEPITDLRNQNKQKIKTLSAASNLQEWTTLAKNQHNLIMESIPIGTYLLKVGATTQTYVNHATYHKPISKLHFAEMQQQLQQQKIS